MDIPCKRTMDFKTAQLISEHKANLSYPVIKLDHSEFVIGRSLTASCPIKSVLVSRNHCTFKYSNDSWTVTDLSSSGTFVNGKRLEKNEECVLRNGMEVRLGQTELFTYSFHLENGDNSINAKRKKTGSEEENLNLPDNICEEFWVNEEGKLKKKEILENHFNSQMTELSGRIKQTQIEQTQMQSERLRLENTLDDKIKELEERFASEREVLTNRIVEGDAQQWQLQEEKETLELRLNEEKAQLTTQMEVQVKELNSKILESYQKELELKVKNQELQAMLEKERIMYEKRLVEEKNMLEDCRNKSEALLKGSIKELEQRYNEDIAKLQNDLDSGSLEQEKMLKTMELLEQKYLDEKTKSEKQLLMEKKSYEEKFQALQNLVIEKEKVVEVTNQKLKEEEDKLKNEANISCMKAKQDLINNFEDVIESELQCSICSELFVNAVTLHCMHTFCEYCISKWKEKKRDCPVCRSKIVSQTRMLVLDSLIDRMLEKLSDDLKHRRQEVVEQRKVKELLSVKPKPSSSESRSNPRERRHAGSRGTNSRVEVIEPIVLSSESESDEDEDTLDSDASSVEGDPSVYYGGYGHCYRCGRRGHWAQGCPD